MALCECGCGETAPLAKYDRASRGYVKGQPYRFVAGHHQRGPDFHRVQNPNPSGLCLCGCGLPTTRANRTILGKAMLKGAPVRFVAGHSMATNGYLSKGYRIVRAPGHPGAHRGGIREHVLVAARALGRPLPKGTHVHHVNEDKQDNRPRNLVICQDLAYHKLVHYRTKALRACGHADWIRCYHCGEWGPVESMWKHPTRAQAHHRACDAESRRKYVQSRAVREMEDHLSTKVDFSPEEQA